MTQFPPPSGPAQDIYAEGEAGRPNTSSRAGMFVAVGVVVATLLAGVVFFAVRSMRSSGGEPASAGVPHFMRAIVDKPVVTEAGAFDIREGWVYGSFPGLVVLGHDINAKNGDDVEIVAYDVTIGTPKWTLTRNNYVDSNLFDGVLYSLTADALIKVDATGAEIGRVPVSHRYASIKVEGNLVAALSDDKITLYSRDLDQIGESDGVLVPSPRTKFALVERNGELYARDLERQVDTGAGIRLQGLTSAAVSDEGVVAYVVDRRTLHVVDGASATTHTLRKGSVGFIAADGTIVASDDGQMTVLRKQGDTLTEVGRTERAVDGRPTSDPKLIAGYAPSGLSGVFNIDGKPLGGRIRDSKLVQGHAYQVTDGSVTLHRLVGDGREVWTITGPDEAQVSLTDYYICFRERTADGMRLTVYG